MQSRGQPQDERTEATVSFHSLVMNGGFLNAFTVMPDKLDLVAAALDALRLEAVRACIHRFVVKY